MCSPTGPLTPLASYGPKSFLLKCHLLRKTLLTLCSFLLSLLFFIFFTFWSFVFLPSFSPSFSSLPFPSLPFSLPSSLPIFFLLLIIIGGTKGIHFHSRQPTTETLNRPRSHSSNKTNIFHFYKETCLLQRNPWLFSEIPPASTGAQSLCAPQILGSGPRRRGDLPKTSHSTNEAKDISIYSHLHATALPPNTSREKWPPTPTHPT